MHSSEFAPLSRQKSLWRIPRSRRSRHRSSSVLRRSRSRFPSRNFSVFLAINYSNHIVFHQLTVEIIAVRFQQDVLKKMDQSIVNHNFNSRTEFIREAVRDKLSDLSKEEAIGAFLKLRGKGQGLKMMRNGSGSSPRSYLPG